MNPQITEDSAQYSLEDIIDAIGLVETLQAIGRVCQEKADHIRTSYDDRTLAASWAKDGEKITKFADKLIK